MQTVEVRCPVGPQKLFTKLKLGEEFATYLDESNLIEFTCSDCAKRVSRERRAAVWVYHRFNFLGELVSTVVAARERAAGAALRGAPAQTD